MTAYTSNPVFDPDQLSYAKTTSLSTNWSTFTSGTDELIIDYTNKLIGLVRVGNLGTDGVTIKCVYSKLKEVWRTDTDLIKFPFPMGPITDEQFEMVNGWNWDKTETSGAASQTTVQLLRTGGWSVVDTSNVLKEMWAGIITLGTFVDDTDQAYIQQASTGQFTGSSNIKLTNPVNQAVQVLEYITTTSSGSSSGTTATVNTSAAHGLTTGDYVYVNNVIPAGYNGTYQVTVTDTDTFTYTTTGSNLDAISTQGQVYFDKRSYFKIFVREYAKIYSQSSISDIGVSQLTYQAYRFPLTNSADLKITHTDAAVGGVATASGSSSGTTATVNTASAHGLTTGDSVTVAGVTPSGYNGTYTVTVSDTDTITYTTVGADLGAITVQGTVTKDVYTDVNITYLRNSNDVAFNIVGDWVSAGTYDEGDVVRDTSVSPNRWFQVKAGQAHTGQTTAPNLDTTRWEAYVGERQIGTLYYPFTIIIDADTDTSGNGDALRAEVYEKVQWYLRQNSDIDADGTASVIGKTADPLLRFVGDTLVTYDGVYIDSFNSNDTNDIEFYDEQGNKRTFPYVATLTLNFGDNLKNDSSAKYWVFYTTLTGAGNDFGEFGAKLVKDATSPTQVEITGTVGGASSVTWTFDYDNETAGGDRTAGTNADVTAVAIGLSTGQYVKATGTIAKSKANSISLVAPLERNYSNPA